ncbi:MAG TPA: flavodoxin family protein [Bacteroidales bacterium]|nr:flavodoxin family protein [Bacteroidales bacterium]
MKHLVIYSHPNPRSFCHAILETVVDTLGRKSNELVVRDLYALEFDPVLKADDLVALRSGKTPADIKVEQDYIAWAEMMTIIHPVWWTGLPAMIKGYIDRVFSHGFAYRRNENGLLKLLTGKKVIVFNTQGAVEEVYKRSGMFLAMSKTSDAGIYEFCGMTVVNHLFFSAVPLVDEFIRKDYLEKVRDVMKTC